MVSKLKYKFAQFPGQLFLFGLICFGAFIFGATLAVYAKDISEAEPRLILGSDIKEAVHLALSDKAITANPSIDDNAKYYPCSGPLSVSSKFGGWKTVSVKCEQGSNWEVIVRTNAVSTVSLASTVEVATSVATSSVKNSSSKPENLLTRAVLLTSLRPGDIITPDDVALREVIPAKATGGYERLSDVIGRRLKRPINTGMVISARLLEPDWMVFEDQSVSIINDLSAFSIITAGKVLENGRFGDRIKVENAASGEIIDVFVASEKKVTLSPKMNVN